MLAGVLVGLLCAGCGKDPVPTMPNVVGLPLDDAWTTLEDAGVERWSAEDVVDSRLIVRRNTRAVLAQDPAPGQPVPDEAELGVGAFTDLETHARVPPGTSAHDKVVKQFGTGAPKRARDSLAARAATKHDRHAREATEAEAERARREASERVEERERVDGRRLTAGQAGLPDQYVPDRGVDRYE